MWLVIERHRINTDLITYIEGTVEERLAVHMVGGDYLTLKGAGAAKMADWVEDQLTAPVGN